MIHWIGAGLSSGPGIVRLAMAGHDLTLWNRTLERARGVFMGTTVPPTTTLRTLNLEELQLSLQTGDIVVSMLPATMHLELAQFCLAKRAHLVTTSYISEGMRQLNDAAASLGLCFVNECGLDPGIDHLLAHLLVKEWKESSEFDPSAALCFRSYCGGVPKQPNDFKYKFSWSPAGVLRALTNRARFLENGRERVVDRAWEDVKNLAICGEEFEVYPNRDSLPYLKEYGFEPNWNVREFVRGTIRLGGWSKAWAHLFDRIPSATHEDIERMGAELWRQYAYEQGEQDRVVLYVHLAARKEGRVLLDRGYLLDEAGTGRDTAMARLVSLPAAFAVEGLLRRETKAGVTGAPHNPEVIELWLNQLRSMGIAVREVF